MVTVALWAMEERRKAVAVKATRWGNEDEKQGPSLRVRMAKMRTRTEQNNNLQAYNNFQTCLLGTK